MSVPNSLPTASSSGRSVQSDNNDPYYLDIGNRLRTQLLSGRFKPGQRFHSIRALIKETGRSLPTVRSALGLLIKEELLEARQGSGYYVTAKAGARVVANRGFMNFLAVIPSSSVPDEPWFMGKIGIGMIQSANQNDAIVSFYRRQSPGQRSTEMSKVDLERITAMNPDGVVWLHSSLDDVGILKDLMSTNLPIITTMRRLPQLNLPLLREDDVVYATMVVSNFEARGHRRIGIILRSTKDDYFRSKVDALREVAESSQVQVSDSDFFPLSDDDPTGEHQAEALKAFLESRKGLTGLLVLASTGIRPVMQLYETEFRDEISRISIIFNVLDGVPVPALPSGESLATIFPPLEKMGEQLVRYLSLEVQKMNHVSATGETGQSSLRPVPRLIPIFHAGDSLRNV